MTEFSSTEVENIIHYTFKDKELLKTAFTHSSFANENNLKSNQRLEYLGDSILSFAVAEYLYLNFNVEEGQMSKWRSKMVNSDNLSNIIVSLGLDKYLLLGKSLVLQELAKSIKEDLFESLVGAIYLDGGMEKAKKFIFRFLDIQNCVNKKNIDYKTALQEEVQKVKGSNLIYKAYEKANEAGTFCAEVYINDVFISSSTAPTKKQAQMECAKLALQNKELLKKVLKTK